MIHPMDQEEDGNHEASNCAHQHQGESDSDVLSDISDNDAHLYGSSYLKEPMVSADNEVVRLGMQGPLVGQLLTLYHS